MSRYEKLHAWRECHELALAVYGATKKFPADERYGLSSQTRRAAFSAAVNIVEGAARHSKREFRRFLDISLSSLSEGGVRAAIRSLPNLPNAVDLCQCPTPPSPVSAASPSRRSTSASSSASPACGGATPGHSPGCTS